MAMIRNLGIGVLAIAVVLPPAASAESLPAAVRPFSRTVLMERFDVDGDGSLGVSERRALIASFGVEVPMLPAAWDEYAAEKRPAYVDAEVWNALDNTPPDNRLTDAGATLGRVLFYDRQLSQNNTIACASCHHQERGFADPRQFSLGYRGGYTRRNAMGLAAVRFTNVRANRPGFFWDERAESLEAQVLMPIQDKVEMGMDLDALESRLQSLPYYPPLFQAAFGSPRVRRERIGQAVAQFMRSIVSFDSKFDRAAAEHGGDLASDFDGLTPEENLGKSLFINGVDGIGEIGCAHCHVPPTFHMPLSLNNGLDQYYVDRGLGERDVPSNDPFTPSNDGKFRAPSLRNIALTAPYMHDGRFQTLEQVVEHYSSGVHRHANVGLAFNDGGEPGPDSPQTSGFHLARAQKQALVAFLKTLTEHASRTDPRFSDPFVRLPRERQ